MIGKIINFDDWKSSDWFSSGLFLAVDLSCYYRSSLPHHLHHSYAPPSSQLYLGVLGAVLLPFWENCRFRFYGKLNENRLFGMRTGMRTCLNTGWVKDTCDTRLTLVTTKSYEWTNWVHTITLRTFKSNLPCQGWTECDMSIRFAFPLITTCDLFGSITYGLLHNQWECVVSVNRPESSRCLSTTTIHDTQHVKMVTTHLVRIKMPSFRPCTEWLWNGHPSS